MQNKITPKIRFKDNNGKEFGEWKNMTLESICSYFKSGESITSSDIFEKGAFKVYGGNGFRGYTNSYTHDGDLILIGRQGALCGNVKFVSGKNYISEHAVVVVPNNYCHVGWLYQKLKLMNLNRYSESSAQPGLSVGKLKKITINVPTLQEQKKIAEFLSKVDEKIASQSKKIEELEKLKRGFMQKIFARELRFKDKNGKEFGAWEEKRLGDVCDICGGGTPDTTDNTNWDGEINWFVPSEIGTSKYVSDSERKITDKGLASSSAKILPIGTILLSTRASIGEMSITKKECSTNQGFQSLIPKKNTTTDFIYYLQPIIVKHALKYAAGSTFLEISKGNLSKCKIPYPSLPEQKKIADFLSKFDERIEVEAEILERWKKIKKGLLQQMFI